MVERTTAQLVQQFHFPAKMSTVSLSLARKVGFGLGCFFNNLTSTVWFTYLLLYYQEVSKLTGQALTLSDRLI